MKKFTNYCSSRGRARNLAGYLLALTLFVALPLFFAFPVRAQTAPAYAGIDHVEFFVADLERSLAFYTKLFGADLWKNKQTPRRYLHLGQSYLALEQQDRARIDHMCFGAADFNIADAHAWLDSQGIAWQDYPSGRDLRVDDHNGIRTQLGRSASWEQLAGTTAAQEDPPRDPGKPIFQALAIDEIFLTVTNLEVDSLFYARLLNQTGSLQAGSLWFRIGAASRLRITQAPVGQMPGVSYFAVHVAFTDMEAAADAVFAAGGIIENILPNGFSFWDPDGLRVVVRTGDLY